jgi:hypothetical protein
MNSITTNIQPNGKTIHQGPYMPHKHSLHRIRLFLFYLLFPPILCLIFSSCAVQPVPALLPMVDSVPPTEPMEIDGVWRVSTIGKDIRIESGRAYAVDGWLHLLTLRIDPNMVVLRNIKSDGSGGYTAEDLPLMGKWQATPAADGALDVYVAGALGPAYYRLLPVELDYPDDEDEEDDD